MSPPTFFFFKIALALQGPLRLARILGQNYLYFCKKQQQQQQQMSLWNFDGDCVKPVDHFGSIDILTILSLLWTVLHFCLFWSSQHLDCEQVSWEYSLNNWEIKASFLHHFRIRACVNPRGEEKSRKKEGVTGPMRCSLLSGDWLFCKH